MEARNAAHANDGYAVIDEIPFLVRMVVEVVEVTLLCESIYLCAPLPDGGQGAEVCDLARRGGE